MNRLILKIYNYFLQHKKLLFGLLVVLVVLLAFAASRVVFKEDISAFLPENNNTNRIREAYQQMSAVNKLLVSVSMADTTVAPDEELMIAAVDRFVEHLQQADSANIYFKKIDYSVEQQQILAVSQFLVQNMPYFLTETDYQRMDSLLTEENICLQMSNNKRMLMSPVSMVMKQNIAADPLHFSAPVLEGLRNFQASSSYQLYNNYIFSSDRREAIITVESFYPASETRKNGEMLRLIDKVITQTHAELGQNVNIHYFGSADIAVTNANRIKQDSWLSSVISIVLILSILVYAFRSTKNLLLMFSSLLFGWLFALGLLSVLKNEVSLIAVGISSIIIGIAVNYPLHFMLHHKHERNIRNVIKDIVAPLTIGNITTVGAFLSLMFISSEAMHDLGLFASLLLVGTICFVLVFLPHLLKTNVKSAEKENEQKLVFERLLSWKPKCRKWLMLVFVLFSTVFCILSFNTKFDANMHNINYMTGRQKADMQKYIADIEQGQQTVYYVSTGETLDDALVAYENSKLALDSLQAAGMLTKASGLGIYLPSKSMQQQRIERWKMFCESKKEIFAKITEIGVESGFTQAAFSRFNNIINAEYKVQEFDYFEPVTTVLAENYIVENSNESMAVTLLQTTHPALDELEAQLNAVNDKSFSFDAGTISRSMIDTLSADFNTVLLICGVLVFVFLMFTLGRIELSILAFLPLTVGWFWILGIMNIFDIRFNIINIILASFIFGQGDDYTIFMTEGLMYEYTYRRKLLASYKNSIILSALIMFVGIGSLILAEHPALRSLAEVTVIGMGSVVLMTFVLPPLVFRFLTQHKGKRRMMPVTLANLANSILAFAFFLVGSTVITVTGFFMFTLSKSTDRKKLRYHRMICWVSRFVIMHIPRVKTVYSCLKSEELKGVEKSSQIPDMKCESINNTSLLTPRTSFNSLFEKPAVIICNHQSHLDLMCVLSLAPKVIVLTNDWVWNSPFYGQMIRYADFYPVSNGVENAIDQLRTIVEKGYSIVIFPEGTRSENCSIQRFHRGAFYLAEQLKLDTVPVLIHGVGHVLPKKEFMLRRGEIHIKVMQRMPYSPISDNPTLDNRISNTETLAGRTKNMRRFFRNEYAKLAAEVETADYYADLVLHSYIYKGRVVERAVRRNLKKHNNYRDIIAQLKTRTRVLVKNCGYGEFPLLLSLVCKNMHIVATDSDDDKLELAANCNWVGEKLRYEKLKIEEEEFDVVVNVGEL